MQTLNYNGTIYEYQLGAVDSRTSITFIQPLTPCTSITNCIEGLFNLALKQVSDLKGLHPEDIVVIEHYPPELDSLSEWQKVTFTATLKNKKQNLYNKQPKEWIVSDPKWHSMS